MMKPARILRPGFPAGVGFGKALMVADMIEQAIEFTDPALLLGLCPPDCVAEKFAYDLAELRRWRERTR